MGIKQIFYDGWKNVLTGLGYASRDKRANAVAVHYILRKSEVESIYSADDIAKKIINEIPEVAVRKWIELTNAPPEEKILINNEFKRLKLPSKLKQAWQWARLYGGSALFLVVEDGKDVSEPLDIERIKNINNIIVLNRWELNHRTITKDINSPNFGMPELYYFTSANTAQSQDIHYTRLIRFEGSELGQDEFMHNSYWNDSFLSAIRQILADYAQANGSLAGILMDFRHWIYKIDGLAAKMMNPDTEEEIKKRLEIISLTRSTFNTTFMDKNEEYEQNTPSLTGFKDLITPLENRLVVASDMPHTKILGDSPSGLGANGNSEEVTFTEKVASEQIAVLTEPITKVLEIVKKVNKINNDKLSFYFVPIKESSEKEEAEIRESMSKADEKYISTGVLLPDEVAKSRFGGEKYSIDTTIDLEQRKMPEEIEEPEETDEDKQKMIE